jgi:hypothetical protein
MMGICKLCCLEKELMLSHIIPEFMYQNIYDSHPKRFYTLKVNLADQGKSTKRIEQKGIRENLLCEDCELLLSKYERYAAETIYGKNLGNKAFISSASETEDKQYFLYNYEGFDYKSFKLFMMSILWRVLVSKTYETPEVSDEIVERLRVAILNEDALEYDDFGCLLQIIFYKKGERAGGFILSPFITNNNGNEVLNILIDGMMYSFYLNSKILSKEKKENFLKIDGSMRIIGRVITKDAGLAEVVLKGYEYFKTIV